MRDDKVEPRLVDTPAGVPCLCRRGVVRPGALARGGGSIEDGRKTCAAVRPVRRNRRQAWPRRRRSENRTSRAGQCLCKLEIGRAHVCTPVTNAHLVCRLLLYKK